MKWAVIIIGSLVGLVVLVTIVGTLLPRDHVASSSTTIRATPDDVYRAITDVSAATTWRNVKTVELLGGADRTLRWREVGKDGVITYEQVEAVPNRRYVTRIADPTLPFGGTWTYDIAPSGDGSRVTITEQGFVSNPIFRFMSKFVFGHHATQEAYLKALGKKYGQDVVVDKA